MEEDWKEDIIKNKLGGKKDWTEQERLELCHQLDKELEKQLASSEKKPMKDRWTEDNWQEKMAEHPIFAPYLEENQGKEEVNARVNDLSEGLAQLKYSPDHNTPIEIALNFKDDGISHFKFKKYRLAKANFTEALKQDFDDDSVRSQLYNNRAAAEWHLENYRSAIKDCEFAIKLKPDYSKAIHRAVQCCVKLKSWEEVVCWCEKGLELNQTDEELIKLKKMSLKEQKVLAAEKRKQEHHERLQKKTDQKLYDMISQRKIRLVIDKDNLEMSKSLVPIHNVASSSPVHFLDSNELVWPVLFLYPEVNQHDCILEFNENHCFQDHLDVMFDPTQPPPDWNTDRLLVPNNLNVYFNQSSSSDLIKVDPKDSLGSCLSDQRYLVKNGTPEFIILVENSQYTKSYIETRTKNAS